MSIHEIATTGTSLDDEVVTDRLILEAKPLSVANNGVGGGDGCVSVVSAMPHVPSVSASAVLGESSDLPPNMVQCRGHEFDAVDNNNGNNSIDAIMKSMITTGFQATNVGLAIQQIDQMRKWRLSDEEWKEGIDDESLQDPDLRKRIRARIFLGYTSNQISSGQREVLKFLVKHKMVDVVVTTAGGIEEDLIKCFQPTYMGDFKLSGRELRKKGINRIGNLLVPNKNYCQFEDWVTPLIEKMHDEQDAAWLQWSQDMLLWNQASDGSSPPDKFVWTPSRIIERLGLEMDHDDSVLTWAARNKIPVLCPALTDGSLGDMLYFHAYKRSGFILDIAQDIRKINDLAVQSHATGMIVLGGGIVKHHVCNANLMRNGANFSVFINTGQEFDGSDSGASPDEAISWGKIRINAQPVKVCADATIVFPLVVSQTFAKDVEAWKASTIDTVCWAPDLDLSN